MFSYCFGASIDALIVGCAQRAPRILSTARQTATSGHLCFGPETPARAEPQASRWVLRRALAMSSDGDWGLRFPGRGQQELPPHTSGPPGRLGKRAGSCTDPSGVGRHQSIRALHREAKCGQPPRAGAVSNPRGGTPRARSPSGLFTFSVPVRASRGKAPVRNLPTPGRRGRFSHMPHPRSECLFCRSHNPASASGCGVCGRTKLVRAKDRSGVQRAITRLTSLGSAGGPRRRAPG
jgi:hypothetical protein